MRKSIPLLSSPGGSDQRDNHKPRLFTERTCCVNPEGGCSSLYNIQWTHKHTHTHTQTKVQPVTFVQTPLITKVQIYNGSTQRSYEEHFRAYSRLESIGTEGEWQ
jgi:hypothetical protein